MSIPYFSPAELASAMSDPEAAGVMPLARQLGEKLGGDPWIRPLEELPRVSSPQMPNPKLWPEHVRAEMEAILRGELP